MQKRANKASKFETYKQCNALYSSDSSNIGQKDNADGNGYNNEQRCQCRPY